MRETRQYLYQIVSDHKKRSANTALSWLYPVHEIPQPAQMLKMLIFYAALYAITATAATDSASPITWDKTLAWIRETFPTVEHVSPKELSELIQSEEKLIILDAREPDEYTISHIARAKRALSLEEAQSILNKEDIGNTTVIVYCSVGYRSSRLVEELQNTGFKKVFNLEGSIFKWANEGYPISRNGDSADGVHPFNDEWGSLLNKTLWQKTVLPSKE